MSASDSADGAGSSVGGFEDRDPADAAGAAGAEAGASATTSSRKRAPQPSGGSLSARVARSQDALMPSRLSISRCAALLAPPPAPANVALAPTSASAPAE